MILLLFVNDNNKIWLFEVLWGQTSLQLLVILSEAKNLASKSEILRFAQNDKKGGPHNSSKSLKFLYY